MSISRKVVISSSNSYKDPYSYLLLLWIQTIMLKLKSEIPENLEDDLVDGKMIANILFFYFSSTFNVNRSVKVAE